MSTGFAPPKIRTVMLPWPVDPNERSFHVFWVGDHAVEVEEGGEIPRAVLPKGYVIPQATEGWSWSPALRRPVQPFRVPVLSYFGPCPWPASFERAMIYGRILGWWGGWFTPTAGEITKVHFRTRRRAEKWLEKQATLSAAG